MAKKTAHEKLAEVEEKIRKLDAKLKVLKKERKVLMLEVKQSDLNSIADLLKEKNMSPDDIRNMLNPEQQQNQDNWQNNNNPW